MVHATGALEQSWLHLPATPSTMSTRDERERTQAIRTWARIAGYTVSDRGRIPSHIVDAYERTD